MTCSENSSNECHVLVDIFGVSFCDTKINQKYKISKHYGKLQEV